MKKTIIFILGIGVLVAIALFALPKAKVVPTPHSDWKTYENKEFKFALQYPAPGEVVLGDPVNITLDDPLDFPKTLVSVVFPSTDTFSENGSHGHFEFQVRLAAANNGAGGCNAAAAGNDALVGATVLAGEPAYIFTSGDAAAGTHVEVKRYALCHNGSLYHLKDVYIISSDGTPLTPTLEAEIAAGKDRNTEIIKTLHFLP